MNKFSELKEREGGFTLIELLVVIIIIGILAAIAIPLFLDQRKLAVDASVKSDVRNTVTNITTAQAVASANNTAVAAGQLGYTGTVTSGNKLAISVAGGAYAAVAAGANTNGPAAGQDFAVRGGNTGGKVFTWDGTTPTTAPSSTASAYSFSSTTGAFATATS